MKLHVLSDLHLEFGGFEPPSINADVVVLAGDTDLAIGGIDWALEHFGVPVIYVAGNHEHYGNNLTRNLRNMRERAAGTNVRFLENEAVRIGDVVFLGATLWANFNALGDPVKSSRFSAEVMADYRMIRIDPGDRLIRTEDTAIMHEHSVAWLTEQIARPRDERIVVVTHHAPSIGSIPKRFAKDPVSASFSSDLDYLIKASGAPLWVHGHTHDSFDYRIGKTRIIANPRGYYGLEVNPQFNPGLVVEI